MKILKLTNPKIKALLWAIGATIVCFSALPFAAFLSFWSWYVAAEAFPNFTAVLVMLSSLFILASLLAAIVGVWLEFSYKNYDKVLRRALLPLLAISTYLASWIIYGITLWK